MNRSRPRAVAVRHVAFEDLGLLAAPLDAMGWDVSYCEAATEDLSHRSIGGADLLIVLGGPIGVGDVADYPFLAAELKMIEKRLRRCAPTFGVGLGAQLMAAALGARVHRGPFRKIGWGPVSLTPQGAASSLSAIVRERADVLHWRGEAFDLPKGATRLAFSDDCDNQAFAFGKRALAVQFHVEAGPLELEEWYVGHAAELAAEGVSVANLRAQGRDRAATSERVATGVFGGWLAGLPAQGSRPSLALA
ncbi:MAG: glutamine amidotransferase [Ancylobacter novellus]|uniref:Glutamine amidotransferase n=1 Tax=Ancylobacter novellus TaxID=921 RepID=A0A2W5MWF4_ANCNO|nr:MAG: glutamine amidotransferase [Ancylobacter novellus]